ncbi:YqhA family protein [Patescibacteria group bacterium]
MTLIISFSLYEIYIKSDLNTAKINLPKALVVCSLDELKAKLTSVVLIILIITYFKYSISLTYNNAYELLAFAV